VKRLALTILLLSTTATPASQYTVAVWDSTCIHVGIKTRAEAPLNSAGEPVWDRVVVRNLVVDKKCFRYEVRH
jgi:hypothetical protein